MSGKPELLAPAGSWDSLVAAVENGADAVYLGGKLFNARQSAGNFDSTELARAIDFAHIRGVKVYVTVNILLDNNELPEAARFLHFIQQCGADAAIVQDLGLIRLARQVIPEMPLHASTQMTIHNLPSALLLKEEGISRVVLARELSLKAIKGISVRGNVEVEVFIHGALCVCYSGQCLMSSVIGGRSGNRGRCAQPCRMQYVLVDHRGRPLADPAEVGNYLLSPRDLNISAHLPELIKAGIASLKIEGRMKRPEYVATVVRVYRGLLDRAAAGGDYQVFPDEARDLAQIFNRDFSPGYFFGRPGRELMSFKRPNNRGVRLGRVKRFDHKTRLAEIALEEPLRVGDGIEVWVTEGGRAAGTVGRIMMGGKQVDRAPGGAVVQLDISGKVFPGDRVFITHDADLMERARASFASPKGQKKIPLEFTVTARAGEPLRVKVKDPDGFAGEAETENPAQVAMSRPLTREYLEKQLARLGNTPFAMDVLNVRLEGEVMAPVSEINEARRKALERLESRRLSARKREPVATEVFNRRLTAALSHDGKGIRAAKRTALSVAVSDLPSLLAAVKQGADEVLFGGDQYRSRKRLSLDDIYEAGEACAREGVRFIITSHRISQDEELDRFYRLLEKAATGRLDGVMAGNLGIIKKAKEITGRPVYADYPLNVYNLESVYFLREAGVSRVTLSPELTLGQIKQMAPFLPLPGEVIVHGALPLMVSEYCAVGSLLGGGGVNGCNLPCKGNQCGLKDRTGMVFPVEVDQDCRMHIFNSRDLCVLDDVDTLAETGVSVLRIEAGREGAGYVRDAVKAYRAALNMKPGRAGEEELASFKKVLAGYSPEGFTKGHYYRGVL